MASRHLPARPSSAMPATSARSSRSRLVSFKFLCPCHFFSPGTPDPLGLPLCRVTPIDLEPPVEYCRRPGRASPAILAAAARAGAICQHGSALGGSRIGGRPYVAWVHSWRSRLNPGSAAGLWSVARNWLLHADDVMNLMVQIPSSRAPVHGHPISTAPALANAGELRDTA